MKDIILPWMRQYRWPLLIVINLIPFLLKIAMYPLGGMLDIFAFPFVFGGLAFVNYKLFDKPVHYFIIQFYQLVCMFCSGCISTYLYYHNISSDSLTPVVGNYMVIAGSVIIVVITVITGYKKINGEIGLY